MLSEGWQRYSSPRSAYPTHRHTYICSPKGTHNCRTVHYSPKSETTQMPIQRIDRGLSIRLNSVKPREWINCCYTHNVSESHKQDPNTEECVSCESAFIKFNNGKNLPVTLQVRLVVMKGDKNGSRALMMLFLDLVWLTDVLTWWKIHGDALLQFMHFPVSVRILINKYKNTFRRKYRRLSLRSWGREKFFNETQRIQIIKEKIN